ncbi:MAG: hypothetical protein ACQETI_07320 [Halobacteriota archaeon]
MPGRNEPPMVESAFALQRRLLRQGQRASQQGMTAQKRLLDAVVQGMAMNQSIVTRNLRTTEEMSQTYVDMLEEMTPGGDRAFVDARDLLGEQLDAVSTVNEEGWSTLRQAAEQQGSAFRRLADEYGATVDTAFDAAIDTNERVERDVFGATGRRPR